MKVKDWRKNAIAKLQEAEVESAALDVILLLEHVLQRDRTLIAAHDDEELSIELCSNLDSLLDRRKNREPLAYVLGRREFYGLDFVTDSRVLVPRPETEIMVEYIAKHAAENSRVLEIGTGSGAIALALKSARPDLKIIASEISDDALELAKQNSNRLKLDVEFITSDLFENIDGDFDVICTNLPYVPLGARRQPEISHEPDVALYGGDDGLDIYRRFFGDISDYASPQSLITVEFSPTQYATVRAEFPHIHTTPISEYIYDCKLK